MGAITFGDNRTDLVKEKLVEKSAELGCDGEPVYDVPGYVDAADLVFNAQGKLGFVWVLTPGVTRPRSSPSTRRSPTYGRRTRRPRSCRPPNDRSRACW